MFKWSPRLFRAATILAAIASFVVASGAGTRWID
jgi:hypothetical protein